jgi:hypothetical protein
MPSSSSNEAYAVGDFEPDQVPTTGPHVLTTIGRPISPEAKRAFNAMVQKDLREQNNNDSPASEQ